MKTRLRLNCAKASLVCLCFLGLSSSQPLRAGPADEQSQPFPSSPTSTAGLVSSSSPDLQPTNAPSAYDLVETNLSPFVPLPYVPGRTPVAPQVGPQPASGVPGSAPGERFGGTSQLASGPALPLGTVSPAPNPLQWGPFTFAPHLDYELIYGNGFEPTPGHLVNSFMNALSPGCLVRFGSHWFLDYTPTLRFYSDPRFQDGTDHSVVLSGVMTYEDWTFGLSQGYVRSLQPLIETGGQTPEEIYSTSLSASHTVGSRMLVDLNLGQNFLFLDNNGAAIEGLTDRRSWSTTDWLNYEIEPRLTAGAGAGFTYDNLQFGPDMTTETVQGRVTWIVERKLNFVLSGGVSDMQFLHSGIPDLISPIFSLVAQYQVFEFTTLSVGASRAVSPSYFQSQVAESTGVNAGISQRLFQHLYFNVSGGYGTTSYHASSSGIDVASVNSYDTASYNLALSTTFLKRASASVFFGQNFVTSPGSAAYNYTTTQGGLTLGYRF